MNKAAPPDEDERFSLTRNIIPNFLAISTDCKRHFNPPFEIYQLVSPLSSGEREGF
jgi:hypothetical protein